MAKFDAGSKLSPGWGCSCPSFRLGEPTPEQAVAALIRSRSVTVVDQGVRDGLHYFTAWTKPGNEYTVVFAPDHPGGWCKHIIACLSVWYPWLRAVAELLSKQKERGNENEQYIRFGAGSV